MKVVQALTAASVFVLSIGGGMALGLATGEQPGDSSTPGGSSSHRLQDDESRPGRGSDERGRSGEKRDEAYGQVLGAWKDCLDDGAADCGPRPRPPGEARGWDDNGRADDTGSEDGSRPGAGKKQKDKPERGDRGRSEERRR